MYYGRRNLVTAAPKPKKKTQKDCRTTKLLIKTLKIGCGIGLGKIIKAMQNPSETANIKQWVAKSKSIKLK